MVRNEEEVFRVFVIGGISSAITAICMWAVLAVAERQYHNNSPVGQIRKQVELTEARTELLAVKAAEERMRLNYYEAVGQTRRVEASW